MEVNKNDQYIRIICNYYLLEIYINKKDELRRKDEVKPT